MRDKKWKEVLVSELVPGDLYAMKEGDAVPADSVVIIGGAVVDESMLTGSRQNFVKDFMPNIKIDAKKACNIHFSHLFTFSIQVSQCLFRNFRLRKAQASLIQLVLI